MDKQALQNSLDGLITEYVANNPRSGEMFERAQESLRGVTPAPVRICLPFRFI